jgi:DNA end-binding protein Ku
MAVRPSWTGHLRPSLVTCPVALYKAVEARTGTHFHLINPKTSHRIHQVAKDAGTGKEVDRKTLVKGFEVSKGKYVLIEPGDLDALKLESTRVLDIERFVDVAEIDRIYWDEPYYLVPDGKTGRDAFAVILKAMEERERVAIGRLVLSQRERIVALEPRDTTILMTTLRAHDEVRQPGKTVGAVRLPRAPKAMLDIAGKIIDQLDGAFDPRKFDDRYENAVKALIRRRQKGHKPVKAEEPEPDEGKVVDLMEQLRRSIGGGGHRRKRANDNRAPRRTRKAA